jgi:hypothetical protein
VNKRCIWYRREGRGTEYGAREEKNAKIRVQALEKNHPPACDTALTHCGSALHALFDTPGHSRIDCW